MSISLNQDHFDFKNFERKKNDCAVIMGGSISGLCCAAAIAPFFEKIVVLDRDYKPKSIGEVPFYEMGRAQTPQDQHIHLLLKQGADTIESFLPGFSQRLIDNGASILNVSGDVKMSLHGKWMKNEQSEYLNSLLITRPVVEQTIREMVFEQNKNIEMVWNAKVVGYTTSDANEAGPKQLTGVEYVTSGNGNTESQKKIITADLYVDAMGFASPSSRFLSINMQENSGPIDNQSKESDSGSSDATDQESSFLSYLGFGQDPRILSATSVNMNLRYNTTIIKTPKSVLQQNNNSKESEETNDSPHHDKSLNRVYFKPNDKKCGGVFLQMPNGYTQITLMGYHEMRPDLTVTDKDSFLKYVKMVNEFTKPEHDVLSTFIGNEDELEIVLGPKPFAVRTQILKRWDKCSEVPDNLIMMGDAYCRFDPAFGQGMTVAALEAKKIREILAKTRNAGNKIVLKTPQTIIGWAIFPVVFIFYLLSLMYQKLSSIPALFAFNKNDDSENSGSARKKQGISVSSKKIMSNFYPIAFVPFFIDTLEAWRYSDSTTGWRPPFLDTLHSLLEWVLRICERDGKVFEALMLIFNMVSYTSILQPTILTKIIQKGTGN